MANIVYTAVAHLQRVFFQSSDCTDKGKPVVRQGHKAVSLSAAARDSLVAESDRREASLDFKHDSPP